jgi:hypothetical protein
MKMGSRVAFFLVIALVAAMVVPGIAGLLLWMAQVLLFAFLVLCGAAFISGLRVVGQ